ncbi:MAG: hypothetical protein AAGI07_06300 [Bacteroidota bacterium]
MNLGFSETEIDKVDTASKKNNCNFIFQENVEKSDEFASIYFTGDYKGKTVVFDAFVYTLEMEFISNIYDAAKDAVIEEHPEFAQEDFDAEEGAHIEMMEDFATELAKDEDFQVCEFLDYDEDVPYGISLDICLNFPEITPKVIEEFVKAFKNNTFQPNKTFYSFHLDEE